MNPAQAIATAFVRAWQALVGPLLPGACRFRPSCSHYALEAIRVHGALRGTWLTTKRLLSCRPGGGFGDDPVPPPRH